MKMRAETILNGHNPAFLNVPLTNPFFPLLVVVTSPDGNLLKTSIIPFPSLSRGGMHYGELCAIDNKLSYPDNLQALSTRLLDQWLGIANNQHENLALGRIEVELQQGATGAEPIFSTAFRTWLAVIMHIKLASHPCDSNLPSKVSSYLEENLATLPEFLNKNLTEQIIAREKNALVGLVLPPDCIPSLHALVTRQFNTPKAPCTVPSFVIIDKGTLKPEWKIQVPPLGNELLDFQATDAIRYFPVLIPLSQKNNLFNAGEISNIPFAVKFHDKHPQNESNLILPLPIEYKKPIFRGLKHQPLVVKDTIFILLPLCGHNLPALSAFLESLQWQTIAENIHIVAITKLPSEQITEKLERFFPGKNTVIENKNNLSRSEQINLATQYTQNGYLLIAHEEIVLHDPRTVETLCLIAGGDKIASASCLLIRDNQEKTNSSPVKVYSGGIFPSHSPSSQLIFSEFDCHDIFPFTTYPVAANSSIFFMVRKDIWDRIGGFNNKAISDFDINLDYGIRSMMQGYLHFCTSIISAGYLGDEILTEKLNMNSNSAIYTIIPKNIINKMTSVLEIIKG
ncbi:hypothetical protein EP47_03595 [Legionella norrlandica]|uniref:Glycosyltransferase n=1 Tax=Legionella norrlandica TaxID=1498499 RepID=A0A0A2STD2_9GAMM|nr:hypothetical protein [Legionella norrlandica]KGP64017.1 hypothetical protein EP47_03595 [Legionella norrlandica]